MKSLRILILTSAYALLQLQAFAEFDSAKEFDSVFKELESISRKFDDAFKKAEERMNTLFKESSAAATRSLRAGRESAPLVEEQVTEEGVVLKISIPEGYTQPEFAVVVDEKNNLKPIKVLEVTLKSEAADDKSTHGHAQFETYSYAHHNAGASTQRTTRVKVKDGVFSLRRTLPDEVDENAYTLALVDNTATITFKRKQENVAVKRILLNVTQAPEASKEEALAVDAQSASDEKKPRKKHVK